MSGVRSSWLMLATNALLAALASSASRIASCSCAVRSPSCSASLRASVSEVRTVFITIRMSVVESCSAKSLKCSPSCCSCPSSVIHGVPRNSMSSPIAST